ncbi:MAG TPA: adenylosuccinate synthase [Proteobacteria bacterium]|nr:adenylosuccinate synthase [Pseudomonadota bacterium]
MPTVAIVGMQWGDEGKGMAVDVFCESADVVVRFQGGNNAGHTVVVGDDKTILHLLPSGILHPGKVCIIGPGVVIDLRVLAGELDGLAQKGRDVKVGELYISDRSHIILPLHKDLDILREKAKGKGKIGTTGRGIGPSYEDKASRAGIRVCDLYDPEVLKARLEGVYREKRVLFESYGGSLKPMDELETELLELAERFRPFVTDTSLLLHELIATGKRVMFEGAQGTMLDIDHGTYPYVTSSSTLAGAVFAGSGIGPGMLDCVIGVAKAYTTRVGSGPFPTELAGEGGDYLRERGAEYGSTTGRPRRCGWLDGVVLKYAKRLNGVSRLVVTKLDVLDGLETIRICTSYEVNGERLETVPASLAKYSSCKPIYEELPGWPNETVKTARKYADLPENARRYLDRICEMLDVELALVSVGPRREETIVIGDPFAAL